MHRPSVHAAIAGGAAALVLVPTSSAAAAPAPVKPCVESKAGALDFWLGDWNLTFLNADGSEGRAVNRIRRTEFGGCLVSEDFHQADIDYRGASWSIYDATAGNWKQTWVDSHGNYFALVGGPVAGQPHIFQLDTVWPDGEVRQHYRMIWERIDKDNLIWRWQKKDAGGAVSDHWVIRYKRAA